MFFFTNSHEQFESSRVLNFTFADRSEPEQMASTPPVASFSTIGILSDSNYNIGLNRKNEYSFVKSSVICLIVLKELPLVNYAESPSPSESSTGNDGNYPISNEPRTCMHKLALLDNIIQKEKAARLLDSNDSNLVDVLGKILPQIDTSKM